METYNNHNTPTRGEYDSQRRRSDESNEATRSSSCQSQPKLKYKYYALMLEVKKS